MCNLYAATMSQDAMRGLFGRQPVDDRLGSLGPREQGYPDQDAEIVRREGETIVLQNSRWGLPSPKRHHSASGIDRGVNAEVAPLHPKAMPAILTEPDEWETCLTAEWAEAKRLQRPLPDGILEVDQHA